MRTYRDILEAKSDAVFVDSVGRPLKALTWYYYILGKKNLTDKLQILSIEKDFIVFRYDGKSVKMKCNKSNFIKRYKGYLTTKKILSM